MATLNVKQPIITAQDIDRGSGSGRHIGRRLFRVSIALFFALYAVITIFPFYILFVRTFVATRDSTDLWLWLPPPTEISMDSEIGNLSVFLNIDIKQLKDELDISGYIDPRTTLGEIAERYEKPVSEIEAYFAPYERYLGWMVLLRDPQLLPSLLRSIMVTVASLAGLIVLSTMSGVALAGLRRKDQMLWYNLFLLQTIIPGMLIVLPRFLIVQWVIHWIGAERGSVTNQVAQLVSVILINVQGGALPIMILTSAISSIPKEMEESAMLDGASRVQYLYYILLPLLQVPLASLLAIRIPTFWNQFFEPYVFLDLDNTTFLPLIQSFAGQYSTNFQVIYTAIFVAVVPMLIVYIAFRRQFVAGVMSGAVKG